LLKNSNWWDLLDLKYNESSWEINSSIIFIVSWAVHWLKQWWFTSSSRRVLCKKRTIVNRKLLKNQIQSKKIKMIFLWMVGMIILICHRRTISLMICSMKMWMRRWIIRWRRSRFTLNLFRNMLRISIGRIGII